MPLRASPTTTLDDAAAADDPPPRGCAWFDSSLELRHGLAVTEHLSLDGLAGQLPPGDWLRLFARTARAAVA
jgi:hypothetical protein